MNTPVELPVPAVPTISRFPPLAAIWTLPESFPGSRIPTPALGRELEVEVLPAAPVPSRVMDPAELIETAPTLLGPPICTPMPSVGLEPPVPVMESEPDEEIVVVWVETGLKMATPEEDEVSPVVGSV